MKNRHRHHYSDRWNWIFPVCSLCCVPFVDSHRQWHYVVAAPTPVVSIDCYCCCWAFVQTYCHLMLRYSYRIGMVADIVVVVYLVYRFFSWYSHCWCCWNWSVVGNHYAALSRDDMMWLIFELWLLLMMISSSSSSLSILWLWSVYSVSYQIHRFHHRNTHIQSPHQIVDQSMQLLALMTTMMKMPPDSLYIECIGMIHQNGQCLRLAQEMTQILRFSINGRMSEAKKNKKQNQTKC